MASAVSEMTRVDQLTVRFRELFGGTPRVYRAPGRINLIGEHTDYNQGFVLPAALTLSCWAAAAPRHDHRIVVRSDDVDAIAEWTIDHQPPSQPGHWSSYVFGVAAVLSQRLPALGGASLLIRSDVPIGGGLASSAALEVAVAQALIDLAGAEIDRTELARLCQRAENEFAGAHCGIMDQFVSVHGRSGSALLVDCRTLGHCGVRIPSHIRLVACNTMVRHEVAGGEYNRRRAECEAGVAHFVSRLPAITSLRDVTARDLEADGAGLSDAIRRRCRHVISENARVLEASSALERADLDSVGRSMADSHRSLCDDYEVSCPELDLMVDLARDLPGVYGARMTGGGFGGCTINLVHEDAVDAFTRSIASQYSRRTGRQPQIYASDAGAGAERIL